jgi:hypothetical protein
MHTHHRTRTTAHAHGKSKAHHGGPQQSEVQDKGVQDQNLLSVDTFLDYYPRYPDIDQVHLAEDEKKNWLALAPCTQPHYYRVSCVVCVVCVVCRCMPLYAVVCRCVPLCVVCRD